MGVDITSRVIVGYTYEELQQWAAEKYEEDSDEYEEALDDLFDELDSISPWFDAGRRECFWGVSVGSIPHGPVKFTNAMLEEISTQKQALKERFEMEPAIYAGANAW